MTAAGMVACASPAVAGAQEVRVVNTTSDHAPDGCTEADCTLREAIADPLAAQIEVPDGEYILVLGELEILRDVTIHGTGNDLPTVRPFVENPSRVMLIGSHSTARLSGLRIANGGNTGGLGGGIFIDTAATLILTDSEVVQNTAGSGGGIWSDGTVHVDRSLVAFNNAVGDGDGVGGDGFGGGIGLSVSSDPATITNTTVSENQTVGFGGGIYTQRSMTLRNVSIVENGAPPRDIDGLHGGGLYQDFESGLRTVASNVLLVRNAGGGCGGTGDEFFIDSTNGMLEEPDDIPPPSTCNAPGASNVVVPDAMVGTLEDKGGPTLTHALLPGSPAINAAAAPCPLDDQRGFPRPAVPAACDVGAYEAEISAEPVQIDGDPLHIWADGQGQLQFRFDGEESGVFFHPLAARRTPASKSAKTACTTRSASGALSSAGPR